MIRAARVLLIVTVVFALSGCTSGRQGRKVLRLDGNWQIAEGAMDAMPASFDHRVDVPGLADGANPPFEAVGEKASLQHRQAFWYRHRFRIKGRIPAVAKLKIHKAAFGSLSQPKA